MRGPIIAATIFVCATGQAAAAHAEQGCSYSLSPLTATVSGAGGSGQVTVTTAPHCTWTATTGTSWLSVSPSAGTGSGVVTWIAAPNTSRLSTQRFGQISVAGRAIFISQTQPVPTTSAPGAPAGLAASVTGSSVTLSWSAPGAGGTPTTYVLAVGSASGLSNLANFATGGTATSFSASNVPSGVYYARVLAQNASGTSAPSNEVTFTVGPSSCSLTPPSALQATVSGAIVTLLWAAPPGAAVSAYVVEAGSAAALSNLAVVNTGSPATVFAAHAPPGTYFVRVRAATPCGVTAATSDVIVVVPQ